MFPTRKSASVQVILTVQKLAQEASAAAARQRKSKKAVAKRGQKFRELLFFDQLGIQPFQKMPPKWTDVFLTTT